MAHNKVHHGKNLRKFREWKDMKQETLAFELGDDWSQKKISMLEQKEKIEDDILKQLATVLKVPVEAFDALNEDPAVNVFGNTFSSNDSSTMNAVNPYCTFNPLDKVIELYERMLKDKEEMIKKLEGLVKR